MAPLPTEPGLASQAKSVQIETSQAIASSPQSNDSWIALQALRSTARARRRVLASIVGELRQQRSDSSSSAASRIAAPRFVSRRVAHFKSQLAPQICCLRHRRDKERQGGDLNPVLRDCWDLPERQSESVKPMPSRCARLASKSSTQTFGCLWVQRCRRNRGMAPGNRIGMGTTSRYAGIVVLCLLSEHPPRNRDWL